MNSSPADGSSAPAPRPSTGRWQRVRTIERARHEPPATAPPPPPPSEEIGATPVYDQLVAEYRARDLTVPRTPGYTGQ
ncbi:hypothetical protein [Streptomyces boluensis]|uniref:Uncharacterized protein n=1 Tax=Streptomyces boluensis TaxID=1775135 RepID=A0A964UU86_9ACTN|nr:hypothetical protein [Streptomyces boluensis]NBE54807.1 hypothetical protein [Streptomyces boluensis]